MQTSAEADSAAWAERMRRRGSSGAAFVGPAPKAEDLEIDKPRFSAFFGTPIDAELRGRGVDTLVVCGTTTECCVDCTARDAFHLDYQVFLAADACAILVTADEAAKA